MPALEASWRDPLEVAAHLEHEPWVLLYSSAQLSYSGRYSYLACAPDAIVEADGFEALSSRLSRDAPWHENAWFGVLGYALRHDVERLPKDEAGMYQMPALWMMRPRTVFCFDHERRVLTRFGPEAAMRPPPAPGGPPPVAWLRSTMSRAHYLQKVERIIEQIHAGALYQANLTRKFHGEFAVLPDSLALFRRLCDVSPAPYSAMIRTGRTTLLSSSPERFLAIAPGGHVTARPIKGSAARLEDEAQDRAQIERLRQSVKDRAENLMIVDLMRNDLARSCIPGSVRADTLFEVTTHSAIHHLSSTVEAQRRPECTTIDVVRNAFPPGSMTGAPKIKAMSLCSELERIERGAYGGALGWFGGDGSCDLSVVIRTLIVEGRRFEFQVGGGIVADSDPLREWEETMTKAQGLLRMLNIAPERIYGL